MMEKRYLCDIIDPKEQKSRSQASGLGQKSWCLTAKKDDMEGQPGVVVRQGWVSVPTLISMLGVHITQTGTQQSAAICIHAYKDMCEDVLAS